MRPRAKISPVVKFQNCRFVLALHHNAKKNLLFDVAVGHFGREAAFFEGLLYLLGEHDGAVFPAGAAEGDGQIAFAFADVMRDQIHEEAFDAAEKFAGLGERADVLFDFGVFSSEAAQAGDEMGIGEEADVEDQVGVRGDAVLVTKTDDGDEHGTFVGIFEPLGDESAEFVDVELGGVDDHVGELADGLHEGALVAEAFSDGQGLAEGVRAAGLAVAAE